MEKLILVQEEPRGPSQLIEIPIVIGDTSVTFPDVPELRSDTETEVIVKAIRLISPKVLSFAPLSGTANTPLADLKKISVILYSEGWEKGQLIPVLTLNDQVDPDGAVATAIPYRWHKAALADWRRMAWQKCKLEFSNGQSASVASTLMFEIEYIKLDSTGKEIIGPS